MHSGYLARTGQVFLYTFSELIHDQIPRRGKKPETAPEGSSPYNGPTRPISMSSRLRAISEWNLSQPAWMEEANLRTRPTKMTSPMCRSESGQIQRGRPSTAPWACWTSTTPESTKPKTPGNNAHNKYYVQMPAFRDLIRFPYSDMNANFSFDADGKYVSQSLGSDGTLYDNLSTTVSSTKGTQILRPRPRWIRRLLLLCRQRQGELGDH